MRNAPYDWVIDSIGAPKVLPDEGYRAVHELCKQLLNLDVRFFRDVLEYVTANTTSAYDVDVADEAIRNSVSAYAVIRESITSLYNQYGLCYEGVVNPFLFQESLA